MNVKLHRRTAPFHYPEQQEEDSGRPGMQRSNTGSISRQYEYCKVIPAPYFRNVQNTRIMKHTLNWIYYSYL